MQLARFNAQLRKHFGLPLESSRAPLPATFAALVADLAVRSPGMQLTPLHYESVRGALARSLDHPPESIPWNIDPRSLFPAGRQRFVRWERLRTSVAGLPPAILSPLVENVAKFTFLAALIAIAVPIAQRLDANEATRIDPNVPERIAGKALGLLLFGLIIALLMVPVYAIGRKYASKLPNIPDMATLAYIALPPQDDHWDTMDIAEHARDFVATLSGKVPVDDAPLVGNG